MTPGRRVHSYRWMGASGSRGAWLHLGHVARRGLEQPHQPGSL